MRQGKITIQNSLGSEIAAAVHHPLLDTKGLAILCPGFLDTKDYQHLIELANDLAKNGYVAVRFDPTGTWESGGSVNQYSISQYLEDIRSIINFMLKEKAHRNVFVIGHSIGGMLSILYAARDPRVTKVVSIMSPFAYVRPNREDERGETSEWAATGFHHSERDIPNSDKIKEFSTPYSFVIDSRKYNARDEVSKLQAPLLLIAGEEDEHVPVEYMKMIYDSANEPKKLVVMEGMGHDYRHHPEEVKLINKEIISFRS